MVVLTIGWAIQGGRLAGEGGDSAERSDRDTTPRSSRSPNIGNRGQVRKPPRNSRRARSGGPAPKRAPSPRRAPAAPEPAPTPVTPEAPATMPEVAPSPAAPVAPAAVAPSAPPPLRPGEAMHKEFGP